MSDSKETAASPQTAASAEDPPPIPSPELLPETLPLSELPPEPARLRETPGSAAGHARTRLVLFGLSIIMFFCSPFVGPDATGLGIVLFLVAGIWHICADSCATARFKEPIEIMPEWSGYSLDEARSSALSAGSAGNEWGRETEAAFIKYAQALAACGLDRKAIAKKLAETGLTYSGAVDICSEL